MLLDRATAIGRVLFTHDADFLAEAARHQRSEEPFGGIVYVHQGNLADGPCVEDLVLLAEVYEPYEMRGRVEYVPLK
jgi:hypothetical protein